MVLSLFFLLFLHSHSSVSFSIHAPRTPWLKTRRLSFREAHGLSFSVFFCDPMMAIILFSLGVSSGGKEHLLMGLHISHLDVPVQF